MNITLQMDSLLENECRFHFILHKVTKLQIEHVKNGWESDMKSYISWNVLFLVVTWIMWWDKPTYLSQYEIGVTIKSLNFPSTLNIIEFLCQICQISIPCSLYQSVPNSTSLSINDVWVLILHIKVLGENPYPLYKCEVLSIMQVVYSDKHEMHFHIFGQYIWPSDLYLVLQR